MLDSRNEGLENVSYEKWNYPVDPTGSASSASAGAAVYRRKLSKQRVKLKALLYPFQQSNYFETRGGGAFKPGSA